MWSRGLDAGMRQQVGVGGKIRPELAGPGAVEEARIATGTGLGGRVRMERRGRRRLTGPNESQQDLAPVVSPTESGQGTGEGTRQGPGRRRTLLSPPTARLGPAGTQRWSCRPGPAVLVPPSWPRRPGPASSAAPFRVTSRVHALPGGYGSHRGPQPSAAAAQRASGACVVLGGCCAGASGRGGGGGGGVSGRLPAEPGVVVTLLLSQQP